MVKTLNSNSLRVLLSFIQVSRTPGRRLSFGRSSMLINPKVILECSVEMDLVLISGNPF